MTFEQKLLIIIISIILLILLFLFIIFPYICYRMTFYSNRKKDNLYMLDSKMYRNYKDEIIDYMNKVDNMPCKEIYITSHDGLKLYGRYFEYEKDAPIEIIFHGYKGDSRRDLSAAIYRCFALKHSSLIVDHRASGKSEGKTITFGVKEVKDVPLWIDYVIKNINKDAKILLGGVSMGAATVMMISNQKLPNNVKGILADCGYTSQKEIIKHYVKNMKFPPNIVYPFIKLGARIYGKFNLEETSPIEAVKKSLYPILFVHGDIDDFVPYNMSVENYNACTSKKSLATIKNADHGLAYLADKEGYVKALGDFFDEILKGE